MSALLTGGSYGRILNARDARNTQLALKVNF